MSDDRIARGKTIRDEAFGKDGLKNLGRAQCDLPDARPRHP